MCPVLYQMLMNTFVRSSQRVLPASTRTLRLRGQRRHGSTLPENPHIVLICPEKTPCYPLT